MNHQQNVERKNLKEVYSMFMKNNILTRGEIAEKINMTYPTVGKMIEKLLDKKLIKFNGMTKSTGGRRAEEYIINDKRLYVIAISFKLGYVEIVTLSLNGELNYEKDYNLKYEDNFENKLVGLLQDYLDYIKISEDKILGIGISFPGVVNYEHSQCVISTILKIKNFDLKNQLEEKIKVPVWIENDVNLMALGENEYNDIHYKKGLLYIFWGTGIGSALMYGDNMTNKEFAGQIGHVITEPRGELCYCGKQGCLETVLSEKSLVNNVKTKIESNVNSSLNKYEDITLLRIIKESQQGDSLAEIILNKIIHNLGLAIVNYIELFDPDLLILNGDIFKSMTFLTDKLEGYINSKIMFRELRDFNIHVSHLGDIAEYLGIQVFIRNKELDKCLDELFGYVE